MKYRGRQVSEVTKASRDVAIKFMFDGLPQSVIDRARREASIRMVSENLVEMIDFIETTLFITYLILAETKMCCIFNSKRDAGISLSVFPSGWPMVWTMWPCPHGKCS